VKTSRESNNLSCKVLVRTLASDTLTIEPMLALPVIKDLIVDVKPSFDRYKSVMPFPVNDDPATTTERLQSAAERARADATTKCILCAACTTACPAFWHGQT
jgi:succinate dehydrogenase / fumarate reductase iron-sulfur subunit